MWLLAARYAWLHSADPCAATARGADFDDNAFEWFQTFRNATVNSTIFQNGIMPVQDMVASFADLVARDALPAVTWLVGPTALSEHAENHPGDGEDLTARLVAVLANASNAAVYAKTVFILNYDEGVCVAVTWLCRG
jgi:phospholipase C